MMIKIAEAVITNLRRRICNRLVNTFVITEYQVDEDDLIITLCKMEEPTIETVVHYKGFCCALETGRVDLSQIANDILRKYAQEIEEKYSKDKFFKC